MRKLYTILGILSLAILFVVAVPASADTGTRVAKFDELTVRLFEQPCTHGAVLTQLEARVHATYKAGRAEHSRLGNRQLCYLELREYPTIFVIDEKGGQADLPKAAFKPALTI